MQKMWFLLSLVLFTCLSTSAVNFLKVNGTSLEFASKRVFLSGANQAWVNYGCDFGNSQSEEHTLTLEGYIDSVAAAGGNSIRMWLFTEGDCIPSFAPNGMVNGTDTKNSLTTQLRAYLQYAASKNVFVILCLWNGALMRNPLVRDLFSDHLKLQSFLDTVLTPLVSALKDEPALAMWEIINEPEGSIQKGIISNEPCFDTRRFILTEAGWAKAHLQMENILHFINWHAAAIHRADPKVIVTSGAWVSIYLLLLLLLLLTAHDSYPTPWWY